MRIDKFISIQSDGAGATGHHRAYASLRSPLYRMLLYYGEAHPSLATVFTPTFLTSFEKYLRAENLTLNTISFYMNTLRTIHRAAVKEGKLQPDPGLFASVFTGHTPTKKRSVNGDIAARLHAVDLSDDPRLEHCRDLFMLCVYLQGIPFKDLLHLRACDLQDDLLTYTRCKTGTQVTVCVSEEAWEYLDRLLPDGPGRLHLLQEITCTGEQGYKQYQNALHRQNRQLKELAIRLGINETLTSHVARHTWATLAHHNGVEMANIRQSLGHRTEKTTQVYIRSLDQDHIRSANRAVADAIARPIREGVVMDVRKEVRQKIAATASPQPSPKEREKSRTAKVKAQQLEIQAQQPDTQILTPSAKDAEVKVQQPEPQAPTVNYPLNRAERRRQEKQRRKEEERIRKKKQKMSVFYYKTDIDDANL
jgi:integrase